MLKIVLKIGALMSLLLSGVSYSESPEIQVHVDPDTGEIIVPQETNEKAKDKSSQDHKGPTKSVLTEMMAAKARHKAETLKQQQSTQEFKSSLKEIEDFNYEDYMHPLKIEIKEDGRIIKSH